MLNADYTPLSYVPLSVWSWQDSMKAVFRDVAIVLASYDKVVSSPSVKMQLPSVIVLKQYVPHSKRKRSKPAFTRRNLYLRDGFCCRYCSKKASVDKLTYDHVVPRSKGGPTNWENVVTCCKYAPRNPPPASLAPALYERRSTRREWRLVCPCVCPCALARQPVRAAFRASRASHAAPCPRRAHRGSCAWQAVQPAQG